MPLAMPVGLLFALLFGVLIWVLPAIKVMAVIVGLAAIVTVIRRPLHGLLIFGVLATFLPYSTVQIGFRTTVSEALLMLVWASVIVQSALGTQPRMHPLMRTERMLGALMLFSGCILGCVPNADC